MKKHEQDITDTSKEIRKSKQERANAKRKFTRKTIGLQEMMMNNSPVMAIGLHGPDFQPQFQPTP